MHLKTIVPSLALLAVAGAPLCVHAIDDDRGVLRVSAFNAEGEATVSGRTVFQGAPRLYTQRFDAGRDTVPAVDARFRIGDRHRLVFNYVDFDGDEDAVLDEPISFNNVVIPAGSSARGEAELRMVGAAYDFAVVEAPTVSAGLQIGIQNLRASGRLRAASGANVYDESDSDGATVPVVGARLTIAPADTWRIDTQVQHIDSDWVGADGFDASLTLAHAIAEYRFGERIGVHAGYKWTRVDADDPDTQDGITGFEQRFNGPVAGVSIAF